MTPGQKGARRATGAPGTVGLCVLARFRPCLLRLRGDPTEPAIVCLQPPGVGADSGSFELP